MIFMIMQYIRTDKIDQTFKIYTFKQCLTTYGRFYPYTFKHLSGQSANITVTFFSKCAEFGTMSTHLEKKYFRSALISAILTHCIFQEMCEPIKRTFYVKEMKTWNRTPGEFFTRLSFLIFCIHVVTWAHRCKRRNKNRVIYHHFLKWILADFVDIWNNFHISRYTRFNLNHKKNMNAQNIIEKNVHYLTSNFLSNQTRTLLKIIPLLFSFKNESVVISLYTLGNTHYGSPVFFNSSEFTYEFIHWMH